MAAPDSIDRWLSVALNDYTNVDVPLGLELRTIARLREHRPVPRGAWALTFAAVCLVASGIAFATLRTQPLVPAPPFVKAEIATPEIQKMSVALAAPVRSQVAHRDTTRGVPIVVAPLTKQEEAIVRMVRNARAQTVAFAAQLRHNELDRPAEPLNIEKLTIAPLQEEEEQ